jgi:hypothetical protein
MNGVDGLGTKTRGTLMVVICFAMFATPLWAQSNLEKIKTEYDTVSAKLAKHLAEDQWIDDDPKSPKLLARQWSLAGEWVAAWLTAHPHAGAEGVKDALAELAPSSAPVYLVLNATTFLVVAPSPIGNVFVVSKSGDDYRLAWSTAQRQRATGQSAEMLAAWLAENARYDGRGRLNWTSSISVGPLDPELGLLPSDGKGHPRFYIEGTYAEEAGGSAGEQISLWAWDGVTAHLQLSRIYTIALDQTVGARMEGDLLKVQQKKFFRTFFSADPEPERQTDWIVRIAPDGMKELGEKSAVPELDAVDELFYRVINGKSATDIAAPAAVEAAKGIVDCARTGESEKEWKEFPNLGMIERWSVTKNKGGEVLCLALIDCGAHKFELRPAGGGFFITDITKTNESCSK